MPQLFVASSEETFADPAHYPWTMGFYPSRRTEGQGYVRTVLKTKPAAKIAVLAPDDEVGTACGEGIREALGATNALAGYCCVLDCERRREGGAEKGAHLSAARVRWIGAGEAEPGEEEGLREVVESLLLLETNGGG